MVGKRRQNHDEVVKLKHDKVFRAMSDNTRRELIVMISETPGINVTALAAAFPVSRFAVMKHLNILEDAGLISRKKSVNHRIFFFHKEVLEEALESFLKRI